MKLHYTFFSWALAILFIAYFGFFALPHSGRFNGNFLESFSNWDGGHYLSIAQYGYKDKFQYAFFPFYPLLIRIVHGITNNFEFAGLLISICSSLLGIYLLYEIVSKDFDKKIAQNVIVLFLIFPTSFFLLTVYSEGLFFLLSVATFFFYRRGNFFSATLAAALASGTRVEGLAVALGFLAQVWVSGGINRKNWFVFFAPLGLLIYCWFLGQKTGDPLYFITAQNHWLRSLTAPGLGFWEAIKNLAAGDFTKDFGGFLNLIFAAFGLGMILRSFRFLPFGYSIYGFVSILLPLFTPSLLSMPRFILLMWPIFIILALVKNKYFLFCYGIISTMLLGIFTVMFVNGFWVA